MAVDFALQQPRALVSLIPKLATVIRAHGLYAGDLADLFAERNFTAMREGFLQTVSELMSRDLIIEDRTGNDKDVLIDLTAAGIDIAGRFTSAWAHAMRALAEVFCEAWGRRNAGVLLSDIQRALPDFSRDIAALELPIRAWKQEEGQ
ncbi:hypothetical protein [Hyalangium sp.]|uniref:hypothetical protein n=1 Tax=Hyalangium sp. TaxID=2028555 RepID=UPI002D2E34B1|nr:hypothetical protein [Hyalangium sp.]HYH98770.1 hypothetical protein [Hyalangium sp.]